MAPRAGPAALVPGPGRPRRGRRGGDGVARGFAVGVGGGARRGRERPRRRPLGPLRGALGSVPRRAAHGAVPPPIRRRPRPVRSRGQGRRSFERYSDDRGGIRERFERGVGRVGSRASPPVPRGDRSARGDAPPRGGVPRVGPPRVGVGAVRGAVRLDRRALDPRGRGSVARVGITRGAGDEPRGTSRASRPRPRAELRARRRRRASRERHGGGGARLASGPPRFRARVRRALGAARAGGVLPQPGGGVGGGSDRVRRFGARARPARARGDSRGGAADARAGRRAQGGVARGADRGARAAHAPEARRGLGQGRGEAEGGSGAGGRRRGGGVRFPRRDFRRRRRGDGRKRPATAEHPRGR